MTRASVVLLFATACCDGFESHPSQALALRAPANPGRADAPFFLLVAAVFKNEASALREWTRHYLREGANHILLIDNDSTDDFYATVDSFVQTGQITLVRDPSKHAQKNLYARYITPFVSLTKWIAVVDLDEFMYGRNGTLADYLKSVPPHIGRLEVPWKMFGSSGHITQPANGIVKNFMHRAPWRTQNQGLKSIVRASAVVDFDVHRSAIVGGSIAVYPLFNGADKDVAQEDSEAAGDLFGIHLNHYPIQSYEWFMRVKASRGDPAASHLDNFRDEAYFRKYDHNTVFDEELCSKYLPENEHA